MRLLAVLVALLALPTAARAGACVFSPEAPAADGSLVCTYADSEDRCAAEAASRCSPEWLQAHPHRYAAGQGCPQAVAAAAPKVEAPAPKSAARARNPAK